MTEYVIKHPVCGFYSEHAMGKRADEFPEAKRFASYAQACMRARLLTCGDSLWSSTCEVWKNYGYADQTLLAAADNGTLILYNYT